jgi:hypothetical protein
VNLAFAIPASVAALSLLQTQPRAAKLQIDVPGTLAASLGLFALVYGFNHAETHGWGATATLGFLAAGVALLAAFVAIERRVAHPLLPLRVVLDRNRGGSYLAVGIIGIGMFGSFFFLTFYLQRTLGYSPIETGLAFLPQVAAVMTTATTSSTVLLPRTGPRPLVMLGLLVAAAGMVVLTQLGVDSSYATHVLPGLILVGLGLGLVVAPALNTATLEVRAADAGVASATVNTMQQIGGSLGTALLSTLAATATSGYLAGKQPNPAIVAQATVHGYTVAFWWVAAIFVVGAAVCGLLLRAGAPQREPAATRRTRPNATRLLPEWYRGRGKSNLQADDKAGCPSTSRWRATTWCPRRSRMPRSMPARPRFGLTPKRRMASCGCRSPTMASAARIPPRVPAWWASRTESRRSAATSPSRARRARAPPSTPRSRYSPGSRAHRVLVLARRLRAK